MAVKVMIPTPLRQYTDKNDTLELEGQTVKELLDNLTNKHSALKKHLLTEEGTLRSFINIYVNDEDIRYLQKEQTPISEKDVVSIVPSIAGGDFNSHPSTPLRVTASGGKQGGEKI